MHLDFPALGPLSEQDKATIHAAGPAALLLWRDGGAGLAAVALDPGRHYTVGRSADTDICLGADRKVSRLHAELRCLGGSWVLTDEGLAKNPTLVNGRHVRDRRVRLRDGDVVRVGSTSLVLVLPAADADLEPTESADAGDRLPDCTPFERLVLIELCRNLVVEGAPYPVPNAKIAERIGAKEDAVAHALQSMYSSCGIRRPRGENRTLLMHRAVDNGLVARQDYLTRYV